VPSYSDVISFNTTRHPSDRVYLNRRELSAILNVYGQMVAAGHWKDYALDFSAREARFAIFRRASEAPLFEIVKSPALAQKQGAWRLVGQAGQNLKRAHDLKSLLSYFDRKLLKLI